MGSCNSNKNSTNNKKLSGQEPEIFAELRHKFDKEIKTNCFYTLNSSPTQEKLISQFENSNSNLSPNNFISSNANNNKYNNIFKKQFLFSYLKSEPLLNNIFPNDVKQSGILFLNLTLFILSNGGAHDRKINFINNLIIECFDNSQKKYDIGKLREIVRNIINVALIIIIYFGSVFLNEEMKERIYNGEENLQIEGKYDLSTLNQYFFDKFVVIRKEISDEGIISIWEDFLCSSFKQSISIGTTTGKAKGDMFILLDENSKDNLKYMFIHMLESSVFFEVFITMQVPDFNISVYKI